MSVSSLEVLGAEVVGATLTPLVEGVELGVGATVVCWAVFANGRAGTIPLRPLALVIVLFVTDGSIDCGVDAGGALGFESWMANVGCSLAIVDGPGWLGGTGIVDFGCWSADLDCCCCCSG